MEARGRRRFGIAAALAVLALLCGYWFYGWEAVSDSVPLHRAIAKDEVRQVRMSVVVYGDPLIRHVDRPLDDRAIERFRATFNAAPGDRIREVERVNPALHAGIAFDLKDGAEVRVQYDREDVYVTRTNRWGQRIYIADVPELKALFEEQLRIAYAEETAV